MKQILLATALMALPVAAFSSYQVFLVPAAAQVSRRSSSFMGSELMSSWVQVLDGRTDGDANGRQIDAEIGKLAHF